MVRPARHRWPAVPAASTAPGSVSRRVPVLPAAEPWPTRCSPDAGGRTLRGVGDGGGFGERLPGYPPRSRDPLRNAQPLPFLLERNAGGLEADEDVGVQVEVVEGAGAAGEVDRGADSGQ